MIGELKKTLVERMLSAAMDVHSGNGGEVGVANYAVPVRCE